ncbi:MAG: isoprenylcysteine carboxylmethyltransferase family protein [Desulfosarcina sp.]|nr:isoprenylcysteine carboxylmethyltransferase family protein [Desulfosarcina sp.]MBC2742350.1 isoprenylcysteine carboxylmethyltransferase family protein [Desulfosarcina sp.]MBC2765261.1 isoprenylcysteine carboxylmethyltransferase family protein [Desulfosarcina sp.]
MPQDDKTTCKLSEVDDAQAMHGSSGQLISKKPGALILVTAAYVLGGGGMMAWLAFLLMGPLHPLDFELGITGRLLLDTLLCLLFFIQHSIMVRRRFRLWLTRTVRSDFHGALYAATSGFCLLILAGLWQPVGSAIWLPEGWIRWAMTAVFLAAGAGTWWGSRSLGDFDALGVKPAMEAFDSKKTAPIPFTVRGPYRWVRHPLYLFSLVIIWSCPIFTADRLLHNVLWTIWIIIGATMEERDLVGCFGDAYRSYRETVPMLLPKSLKPLMTDFSEKPKDNQ